MSAGSPWQLANRVLFLALVGVCGLLWARNAGVAVRLDLDSREPLLYEVAPYGGPELLVVFIGSST